MEELEVNQTAALEVAEEPEPVEEVIAEDFVVEAPAGPDEDAHLKAIIEAAIYITDEPLTPAQIAVALGQPADRINRLLDELAADYNRLERGLSIREIAGGYKMATKPEHHEAIRRFVKNLKPPLKLSLPALETLAVIAYKQPVTAPEIMEIRGVQGVGVLKTLLDRKLIAAGGRKQVIGKPILYKTTKEFLVQFGLKDLNELPTLKEFEDLGRLALNDTEPDPSRDPEPIKEPEPAPPPVQDPIPPEEPVPPTDPQHEPVKAEAAVDQADGAAGAEAAASEGEPAAAQDETAVAASANSEPAPAGGTTADGLVNDTAADTEPGAASFDSAQAGTEPEGDPATNHVEDNGLEPAPAAATTANAADVDPAQTELPGELDESSASSVASEPAQAGVESVAGEQPVVDEESGGSGADPDNRHGKEPAA